MSKEITIDKKTNIRNILNKEKCEVLTLKCRVNPRKLKDFTNVKELIIDYVENRGTNYNERNLSKLVFINKLEKITFKQMYSFGREIIGGVIKYYKFKLPNLKAIEFPVYINNFNEDYLDNISSLEEIIFNFNDSPKIYQDRVINVLPSDIKRIIIKYKDKEYTIEPKYKIESIDDLDYDVYDDEISLEFSNEYTDSEIYINTKTNLIRENHDWEVNAKDNTVYIPDYATNINDYVTAEVKRLSLNLNLLNHVEDNDQFIYHCNKLKKIELRSNNEMSLMDKKIINVSDYGELQDIFIEDYCLVLEYKNFKIYINNKGEINKKDMPKDMDDILDEYSLEELEIYASFLRLLKISNDLDYQNAMNVVEQTLVKKYPKFSK